MFEVLELEVQLLCRDIPLFNPTFVRSVCLWSECCVGTEPSQCQEQRASSSEEASGTEEEEEEEPSDIMGR